MNTQEYIINEQSRATAFNIFTALLCQPDEEVLSGSELYDTLQKIFDNLIPDAKVDCTQMQEAAKKYTNEELLVEYTKLFLGPFKVLAPPYSSIYLGATQLMSDDTVWAANFYKQTGLAFNMNLKDLPDHIAVETEFMYYLSFNCVNEIIQGNHEQASFFWLKQSEFFNSHYKKWVPRFCEQVIKQTTNEFYIAFAKCFNLLVSSVNIPALPKPEPVC